MKRAAFVLSCFLAFVLSGWAQTTIQQVTDGDGNPVLVLPPNSRVQQNGKTIIEKDGSYLGSSKGYVNVTAYGAGPSNTAAQNATAFAAAVAAANASTDIATFFVPLGTYSFNGSLTFTKPAIVQCQRGAVLNYTGSGIMFKFGSDGQSPSLGARYVVDSCGFTGGASMTHGLYFNVYSVYADVTNNVFLNFGNATGYAVYGAGYNWDVHVQGNKVHNNDNAAHNFFKINALDLNSQARILDNNLASTADATGMTGATTAGVGIWVDGYGSQVVHNNIAFFNPDVRVGSSCPNCSLKDNYFENPPYDSTASIQYGDPAGGANPAAIIDGLQIEGAHCDIHAQAHSYFIAPTTSSAALRNAHLSDIACYDYPAANEILRQNNLAGQTGNSADHILSTTEYDALAPRLNIGTTGGSIDLWTVAGTGGSGQPVVSLVGSPLTDTFSRANCANLASPCGGANNWTSQSDAQDTTTFKIASSAAVATLGSAYAAAYYSGASWTADQCSWVTVNGTLNAGGYGAATVRNTAAGNYYAAFISPESGTCTNANSIQKIVNGVASTLASSSTCMPSATVIKLCAVGSALTAYYNGTQFMQATDAALSSGAPGFAAYNNTATFASWGGATASQVTDVVGTGAPVASCATGSTYRRMDGGAGTTLYVCEAGAWAGK